MIKLTLKIEQAILDGSEALHQIALHLQCLTTVAAADIQNVLDNVAAKLDDIAIQSRAGEETAGDAIQRFGTMVEERLEGVQKTWSDHLEALRQAIENHD